MKIFYIFYSTNSLLKHLIENYNEIIHCDRLWEAHKKSFLSRHQIMWLDEKRKHHKAKVDSIKKILIRRNKNTYPTLIII